MQEAFTHLDLVTKLKTPSSMELDVACGRWHGELTRMFKINGTLEF